MRVLLELAARTACVACGDSSDGELCARCADDVVVLTESLCERCGAPRTRSRCPCDALQGFESARSLVAFAEPARSLTLALKRRARPDTVGGMGELLGRLARTAGFHTGAESVTFVPGGAASRRRGFDHAELLCRSVARALGARSSSLVVRKSDGPRQADVPITHRRRNVADRFGAKPVHGRVILVDDVFTTGATAEACALALRRAGATSVHVLTWARTLRKAV
jgi:ComF family protein